MAGRYPRGLPNFINRPWDVQTTTDLQETFKSLFDSALVVAGTPGDPSEIQADSVASPGTLIGTTPPALDDHVHPVDTSGTPGVVGATSAQGVGSGLAVTDHTHRLGVVGVKGDVLGYDGANPAALSVGLDGQVLTADASQATGLRWTDAAAGMSMPTWIGL
jgi:hypothetical protein